MDALVFDFDGTIVDTESAEYESIRAVWADHGRSYDIERWMGHVGTTTAADWVSDLEAELRRTLPRAALHDRQRQLARAALLDLQARPGVLDLIATARAAGVGLAVASNAPTWWLEQNLSTLGVLGSFDVLVGVDVASAPKPHPAPYREACAAIGADPARSVAFEDSMVGVHSAVAAGCFTVACRGPLTFAHDLSAAHRLVGSLAEVTLGDLRVWREAGGKAGSVA